MERVISNLQRNKMEFPKEEKGKLEKLFRIPPLSVLNPLTSRWMKRKKYWLDLGIQSELGRAENLLHDCDLMKRIGNNSTSIFDPVLAECIYLWFSKENDKVLDPFAGGSVRGIVASKLRRNYTGIDISENQIKHNILQGNLICPTNRPNWIVGDSRNMDNLLKEEDKFDLIFSCPPYFNLEKYSEKEGDLSNMEIDDFFISYFQIILNSCKRLKENSFAVFVVGEVRINGEYIGLVQETIEAFRTAGFQYYNEMILLQSSASAAMRAEKTMNTSRKVPKIHQQVLVFVKGNPFESAKRMGAVKLI